MSGIYGLMGGFMAYNRWGIYGLMSGAFRSKCFNWDGRVELPDCWTTVMIEARKEEHSSPTFDLQWCICLALHDLYMATKYWCLFTFFSVLPWCDLNIQSKHHQKLFQYPIFPSNDSVLLALCSETKVCPKSERHCCYTEYINFSR